MRAESQFVSDTVVNWRESGAIVMIGKSSQPWQGRELLVVVRRIRTDQYVVGSAGLDNLHRLDC